MPDRYRLVFAFNHLIFDGESIKILQGQLQHLLAGREKPEVKNHYAHYVELMASRDYSAVTLDNYLDLDEYTQVTRQLHNSLDMGAIKNDTFEIDLSSLHPRWSHLYNEILLVAYARFLADMFEIPQVPLLLLTSGRNYQSGNFSMVLGDFHDYIPLLLRHDSPQDPVGQLEHIVGYRKYIREHNINFVNFISRSHLVRGIDHANMHSPFVVNSLVGLRQYFTDLMTDEIVSVLQQEFIQGPLFDMEADNVRVDLTRNLKGPYRSQEIKERLLENYHALLGQITLISQQES